MHVREERVLEYLSDCVAAWWVIDCPCCRCEFVWLLSRIPSKILKMYFSRCIYINMHINLRKWLPRKKIRVEVGCVVWGSVLLRAWVVWVVGWRSSYINNVSSHCLMTRGATKIVDWHHVTLQYKDRRIINKTQKTEKKNLSPCRLGSRYFVIIDCIYSPAPGPIIPMQMIWQNNYCLASKHVQNACIINENLHVLDSIQ